jgi:hypothetical protein
MSSPAAAQGCHAEAPGGSIFPRDADRVQSIVQRRTLGANPAAIIEEKRLIHELRVYHCVTGRLPALLKRFEGTTLALWAKHGIRQAGFWTVVVGESNQDLFYLLQWESLAEREKRWTAFMSDPEWIAKRAESERDGPIVASISNTILQPTTFSAVK